MVSLLHDALRGKGGRFRPEIEQLIHRRESGPFYLVCWGPPDRGFNDQSANARMN